MSTFEFLLGQAKWLSMYYGNAKIEQNMGYSLLAVFFNSVKSRILIDFRYFKAMNDLSFPLT